MKGHQYQWFAGGYDLETGHFYKWLAWWLPDGWWLFLRSDKLEWAKDSQSIALFMQSNGYR